MLKQTTSSKDDGVDEQNGEDAVDGGPAIRVRF
jgi:hypothetical protein